MKIMKQSNFQKITDFHICFGHPYRTEKQLYVLENEPKLVSLRYELINEEIGELNEAYQADDVKEIIDALTDILYVVYGMAAAFGIDADQEFCKFINENFKLINEAYKKNITLNDSHSNYQHVKVLYCNSVNTNEEYNIRDYLENVKVPEYRGILDYHLAQINYFNKMLKVSLNQQVFNDMEHTTNQLLYYTYLMGILCGVDLDASYTIVHNSNMSKICSSEEEAQKTVKWYQDNDKRYDSPTYKKNEYGYVVYNENSGKTLKNINYTPANFESLLK